MNFSLASDIVELVILTTDEAFLQTLREAVGGSRRLWHVLTADKVSDLLVAGQVGILVLDVTALHESAGGFLSQIKRQFPDLVVVVAGKREAETSLAGLISTGVVYRFIHKPMSPGRAKLFADAAVKKYEEQRRRPMAAPATVTAAPGRRSVWLSGAGVVIATLGVAAWLHSRKPLQPQSAQQPAVQGDAALLASAAAALAANRLTQPGGDNALELYLQAVARDPSAPAARAGLAEVRERLAARAQNALLEERLDEAAAAIEAARTAGVAGARIVFLTSQLARARTQLKSTPAAPPRSADTRASKPGADDKRRSLSLELANKRIEEGRLIEPDRDNARYYVMEARGIDPQDRAALAAEEALAVALLSDARAAIGRHDFPRAVSLLDAANGIASPSNVDNLVQLLRSARRQAEVDSWERLLTNGRERLQQDSLLEPTNDSAKYYLLKLRNVNPGNAGLAPALQELGNRLVTKARSALSLQQNDTARSLLDEADGIGFKSTDAVELRRDLNAAAERQRFVTNVISAKDLTLVKSVPAVYPPAALQNRTEGWVDLEFTVAENGAVREVAVHAATPAGTFEAAAMAALSQWRYQPVLRDGAPAAQRARIRVRFVLAG